jgi:oligopeptide transport system substrate-binding protein
LHAVGTWQGTGLDVEEERAFEFDSAGAGYLRRGRAADSSTWAVATLLTKDLGLHLLYSAPQDAVGATYEAFLSAARSLRLEPTEPIEVDRAATLSLEAGQAEELDPALTHVGPSGAIGDLYRGLVVLDPNLQIRPALAEDWQVSPDGSVYTFFLNPNARFHNGRPVMAEDVVFSWERAASPELASSTVMTYMGDIAGLATFHAGQADSIAGVTIVDEHTLEVRLESPRLTFLYKLAYPVSWIVDRYNVGFPGWERHPNGTGPFRVLQHVKDQTLLLESNPWFYDGQPAIQYVRYLMYAGYAQQLYEQGEVDQAYVTRDQISRVEDPADGLHGTLVTEPAMCTYYVSLNTAAPPFDDPVVRQAFARAVDRERYVEAITYGEDMPAVGLLPPGMPGYGAALEAPTFDPAAAQALLDASRYAGGRLPEIVWTVPTNGGYASSAVSFLADTWRRELGVDVTLEGIEWQDYYARLDAGDYGQILLEGWCADYPDPENFLEVLFETDSAQNHSHYSNGEFDALIKAARVEANATARLELFRRAEQLLLDDSPAIFLSYSGPAFMTWKPYVGGYVPAAIGVPQHHTMWLGE